VPRPVDRIRIESEAGSFNLFTSCTLINDLLQPSELSFECGNDDTWRSLRPIIAHGKTFKVYLNDRIRLNGKVYSNRIPMDANGSTVQVTIKSRMADAWYASADPRIRVQNTSVKEFLLALYKPLGFTEQDFIFRGDVMQSLMTGQKVKGGKNPRYIEGITLDQAKVQIPETIHDAAARHLKRHGLSHWDTPDGRIYVGPYDDQQMPIYRFSCRRDGRGSNNILSATKIADWSDVPSVINVFGFGSSKDVEKTKVGASSVWQDVVDAGFYRPVYIQNDNLKSQELADRQARQERANRSRQKDAYEVTIDGWSYWNGSAAIPYAPNTTADVDIANHGGGQGKYYCFKTSMTLDAMGAASTSLSLAAPGIFDIG
jgi:prophage tail gpP-like protein